MTLKKKPVTGMKDILPQEMAVRDYVIGLIKETYRNFGFSSTETPCVEHIENLNSKQGGENEKLIFKILKRGEKLKLEEAKEEAAIAKAIENAQMDIPEAMIDTQTRQMMDEFASRLQQQGLALQQYYQFTGMDNDKLAEQMKPNALKRIQTRLVLEAVVKAEDIKANEEEYKAEVEKMAKMYQMETEKLEQLIGEAEAETMKEDIAVQKAADLIRDTAKEV